jgi:hypothetical protein
MKSLRLLALVAACFGAAATGASAAPQQTSAATMPSGASMALHQDMRKLWTDHVVWTRNFVISAVADLPDVQAVTDRLMKNQEDIGKAVENYYGAAAGTQLTTLLKDHIAIAGDLVKAAKAGDKAGQQKADTRWQENAVQIADFLAKANPNWPRATLVDMMKMHLSTTTNEVVMRLNKNWAGDVQAYDAVSDHILKMSDALADGIVKQFPEKFGNKPTSTSGTR